MVGIPTPCRQSSGPVWRRLVGPVSLLVAIFFFNFTGRIVFAPLLPTIEADLDISHATAGGIFLLISLGYFVSLLASGWVAARLGHTTTIAVSSLCLGLTLTATAATTVPAALMPVLFLLGASAGLYLPSGIAVLTEITPAQHWGKVIAVHELAPNLAFIAAPVLSELILLALPWRMVPLLLAIAALALAAVIRTSGRLCAPPSPAPVPSVLTALVKTPAFWIMALLFALGISSTLGIYAMTPLFLTVERGIEREFANTFLSLSRISCLFMALAGGWAADRFGAARTIAVVLVCTGGATMAMGLLPGRACLAAVLLQPALAVCFFPAGFAALSRIGPPGGRNIAVSLAVPMAFLVGGGGVPSLIGWMGDQHSFAAGIALIGGVIATGAVPALWLHRRLQNQPAVG